MLCGRSRTLGMSSGSTPFRRTPVAVRVPWVTIIGLMTKGATPMTCGTSFTFFMTSRYSWKSLMYFNYEDVRVDPQHLVAELLLEAAGDAHHRCQGGHAEGHPEHREGGSYRHERLALLGSQVTEGRGRTGIPWSTARGSACAPKPGTTVSPAGGTLLSFPGLRWRISNVASRMKIPWRARVMARRPWTRRRPRAREPEWTDERGPSAGDELIGQIIADRWVVERKLGQGGMGVVYAARHTVIDRRAGAEGAARRTSDAIRRSAPVSSQEAKGRLAHRQSAHLRGERLRGAARRVDLLRDGAAGRAEPGRDPRRASRDAAAGAAARAHRAAGGARAGRGARRGDHPPRSQAGQRDAWWPRGATPTS